MAKPSAAPSCPGGVEKESEGEGREPDRRRLRKEELGLSMHRGERRSRAASFKAEREKATMGGQRAGNSKAKWA